MSRSSSCARFPARLSRVAGGVIGLRTRDVIIAIVAHSRRRHRSKSFVLSASISFRSSSRAARDTLRSLSLSRSLDQERDHLYYQKGIRPRRRRSLSKVSKRLSRGVVVASPPHSKRYRPISRVFARLRHRAVFFSLLRAARQFWIESESESNRTRFCFRRSRTQNGKNNDSFSPFQSQQKPPL